MQFLLLKGHLCKWMNCKNLRWGKKYLQYFGEYREIEILTVSDHRNS